MAAVSMATILTATTMVTSTMATAAVASFTDRGCTRAADSTVAADFMVVADFTVEEADTGERRKIPAQEARFDAPPFFVGTRMTHAVVSYL
jgi:hypothetical protein